MQFNQLKRREFITLFGSAAAAWPLAARAQQAERVRRIVLVHSLAESDPEVQARITIFRQALETLGWTENRNLQIGHLFSAGEIVRMQAYIAKLVHSPPDLIVASSTPVLMSLKEATRSTPIVFAVVNDPVGQGLIDSLARPGGNITGFTFVDFPLIGKWLEMLKEIAPSVKRVGLLFNPQKLRTAATTVGAEVSAAPVHDESEVEAAVTAFGREPGGGLILPGEPFTNTHRGMILALTQRYRLPVICGFRQYVREGALISYGPDTLDIYRRLASYVDRILRGEQPGDLPVQAPTKYGLAINVKAAKALGLTVPDKLLALADEVIE